MKEITKERIMCVAQRAMPLLIREHDFWTTGPRAVPVLSRISSTTFMLSRYYADTDRPRPESYKEDLETLEKRGGSAECGCRDELFREIASATESGQDFSSRWLRDLNDLSTIHTTEYLPVDLNAFLHQLEENIAYFATYLGGPGADTTVKEYRQRAQQRQRAFDEVFWDSITHQWRDLRRDASGSYTHSRVGYLSHEIPLACGVALPPSGVAKRVISRLGASSLITPGGSMTSSYKTGHQWDAPNVWPPLQCLMIDGLHALERATPGCGATDMAERIALGFLRNAFKGYLKSQCMFEKYTFDGSGSPGSGGEYDTQHGFGWTNGAALWLLRLYGNKLTAHPAE